MDRLSEVLGERVQFQYTCLDRIVLQGYLTGLQRPEHRVYFYHDVVGVACIEPKVLAGRTAAYRDWVDQYTQGQGSPVVPAPQGVRKEELVRPSYGQLGPREGIVCVLTSLENTRTFISYTPQRPPRSGDETYRRIETGRQRFLPLYWYVWDPSMGPLSLRGSTHLPFTVTCYLNGHHCVSPRLREAGVACYQQDHAILSVADPVALQAAAQALTPAVLQERCDDWAAKVAPQFSPAERARVDLRYRSSLAQIEVATDGIFHQPSPWRAQFRRAVAFRLLDVLLHPGTLVADWTSRDVLARLLARQRLSDTDDRLSQLRYDLGQLRAHGFVERIGRTRRYRLTPLGLKLGVLLATLRTRLLGPITTLATAPAPLPDTTNDRVVEAAFRQVDRALDHLCSTLGLTPAA